MAKNKQPTRRSRVHPGLRAIHDLLYLDMDDDGTFYNPSKNWDSQYLEDIARIVARYVPRPPETERGKRE